jgi:UDP-N-acetylglucosamine 3-dehydrogenase
MKLTGTKKRIVLTGCGAVSEHLYAPAIRRLVAEGAVDDVLLIDRAEKRIRTLRRILPRASGYADLAEALPQLDESLVIVALPHNLHAPVTIKALEAGAHVLCEKPMAVTAEECDQMLAAAAASSRLLAVGSVTSGVSFR